MGHFFINAEYTKMPGKISTKLERKKQIMMVKGKDYGRKNNKLNL